MTSHVNIDWAGTGELNRREFNTIARWSLKNTPQAPISTKVFKTLSKPYSPPVKETLHRRDVSAVSPNIGVGTVQSPNKFEVSHLTTDPKMKAKSGRSSVPLLPDPRPTSSGTVQEKTRPGSSPALQTAEGGAVAGASPGLGSTKKHLHCRRKHKKDCPKHILNEQRRRDTAIECGEEPMYSPVLDEVGARQDLQEVKDAPIKDKQSRLMMTLPAPDVVHKMGHATSNVLTGIYNEHYTKWDRRMFSEHPDFTKMEDEVDASHKLQSTKKRRQRPINTRKEHPNAADPAVQLKRLEREMRKGDPLIGQQKFLRDEFDVTHYRRKYDMKNHMEALRNMGTALLRDF